MSDQQEHKKISTPLQDMLEDTQKDSTTGPVIGSIIIIIIILIGGLYFLGSLIKDKTNSIQKQEVEEQVKQEVILEKTVEQSASTDIQSIEADLEATNLELIDDIFKDLEKEF